jgi:tetratricopeptide (TPR) repeat protein
MRSRGIALIVAALLFSGLIFALLVYPYYLQTIHRFLGLPPIWQVPKAPQPKDTVDWAQEVLRTGHQLVSYIWVLGAIGIGTIAAVAYYVFTWAAEHREIIKSMQSWQEAVGRAEVAALEAAKRLPPQVFMNFKNPEVRARYERDILALRSEASPEEVDLHVQTIALLTTVPSDIYIRLGNYFRYRSHTARDTTFRDRDLWFAIRRYRTASELATQEGRSSRLNVGYAAHGVAICLVAMGMREEGATYAKEAVDCLEGDLVGGTPPLVTYGATLIPLGRYEEAEQALRKAVGRAPHDVVAVYNLACVLCRLGDRSSGVMKERLYRDAIERLQALRGRVGSDMRTINLAGEDRDFQGLREDPTLGPVFAQAINELKAAG